MWNLNSREPNASCTVLKHVYGGNADVAGSDERPKDITTMDWNCDGALLATGSYDGHARVWTKGGEWSRVPALACPNAFCLFVTDCMFSQLILN